MQPWSGAHGPLAPCPRPGAPGVRPRPCATGCPNRRRGRGPACGGRRRGRAWADRGPRPCRVQSDRAYTAHPDPGRRPRSSRSTARFPSGSPFHFSRSDRQARRFLAAAWECPGGGAPPLNPGRKLVKGPCRRAENTSQTQLLQGVMEPNMALVLRVPYPDGGVSSSSGWPGRVRCGAAGGGDGPDLLRLSLGRKYVQEQSPPTLRRDAIP